MEGNKVRFLDIIICAVLLVSIVASCVSIYITTTLRNSVKEVESNIVTLNTKVFGDSIDDAAEELLAGATVAKGDILSGDDKATALSMLENKMYDIWHSDCYFSVPEDAEGTDYTFYLYNTDGESISQASDGSMIVSMNNKNSYFISDSVGYMMTCPILETAYYTVKAAKNGNGSLLTVDTNDIDDSFVGYAINLHGYDEIKKMYQLFDSSYADTMVEQIKNVIIPSVDWTESNADTSEVSLRIEYFFDKETGDYNSCIAYFYLGSDDTVSSTRAVIYWQANLPYYTKSWSLGSEWYDFDPASIETDEGLEQFSTMLKSLDEKVRPVIDDVKAQMEAENAAAISENPVQISTDATEGIEHVHDHEHESSDVVEIDLGAGEPTGLENENTEAEETEAEAESEETMQEAETKQSGNEQ